jgi:hypothetical protein
MLTSGGLEPRRARRLDRTITNPCPTAFSPARQNGMKIDWLGFDPAEAGEMQACLARRSA